MNIIDISLQLRFCKCMMGGQVIVQVLLVCINIITIIAVITHRLDTASQSAQLTDNNYTANSTDVTLYNIMVTRRQCHLTQCKLIITPIYCCYVLTCTASDRGEERGGSAY